MELSDAHLAILQILADDNGHPRRELAEKLGIYKTNINRYLKVLEEDIAEEALWGCDDSSEIDKRREVLLIHPYDLKNPTSLASKFRKPEDPLTHRILEQISPRIRAFLDDDSVRFQPGSDPFYYLVVELNRIIEGPYMLRREESNPQDLEIVRLNRLLLEDVYPKEIAKYKKPIIYKGPSRQTTKKGSKRPKAMEHPFYINPDLSVFEIIITYLDYRSRQKQMELAENLYTKRSNKEPKKSKKIGISVDIGEFISDFLTSNYVRRLVIDFGLIAVIGVLNGMDIDEEWLKRITDQIFSIANRPRPEDIEANSMTYQRRSARYISDYFRTGFNHNPKNVGLYT